MSGTEQPAAVEPVIPAVTEPVSTAPQVETPVPEATLPEPQPEAPATPETPAAAEQGLLSKPAEAAETAEPAAPVEQAPERLTYEAPTLPEGVTLEADGLSKFDEIVGTHRVPAEARQELIDMFLTQRQSWAQQALQSQVDTFAQTRKGWRDQVASDEQIGGAGMATSIANALHMIDMFVAPADRAEFDKALEYTGMTDHPQMIKFLNNVHKKFGAPPPPTPPNNPPPDRGRQTPGGRRMRDLYTHERSPGNRS